MTKIEYVVSALYPEEFQKNSTQRGEWLTFNEGEEDAMDLAMAEFFRRYYMNEPAQTMRVQWNDNGKIGSQYLVIGKEHGMCGIFSVVTLRDGVRP